MKKQIRPTLNDLANDLFNDIHSFFDESVDNFFDGAYVITPNKKMESWIKAYWLKNSDKVLMNVNFINLETFLLSIFDINHNVSLATNKDYKNLLIKLLAAKPYEEVNEEIRDYLFNKKDDQRIISPTKINELADTLATLFINYEKECIDITGWQKDYYDSLLNEFGNELTTLSKLFNDDTKIKSFDSPIFIFGFLSLDELSKRILEKYSNNSPLIIYELEERDIDIKKYEISSSPSLTKEIEVVHSKICTLLKDKDLNPTDFLVIGNNIGEYENVIKKVFIQDENEGFPSLPFSISASKNEDSHLTTALSILLDISNKGFFTRLDFFSLINNPLIQSVRDISLDQIEQWMNSIYNLNIYRGNLSLDDDWDYIRKRVLLSKISNVNFDDNIVSLEGEDYIPYSMIGLDDNSIVSFVSILDDLNSWIKTINSVTFTFKDELETIKKELDKWFLNKNASDINQKYKKASSLFDYWINKNIIAPRDTFFQMFLNESLIKSISYKEPFVTGITFMDFSDNVIHQTKHIFFINAGSNSLPKKIVKNELDLRESLDNNKEKKAFQYLYQNSDHFHISFIGMDLKKDAELFESTLSKELRLSLNPKNEGEKDDEYEKRITEEVTKYSIDEKRSWEELYTRGEYNRKDYFEGLSSLNTSKNIGTTEEIDIEGEVQERRNKISTKDVAKYLEEPLSYKAKYLFGDEDDSDELNHEEYEPFSLNTLEEYLIVTKICELQANYIKEGQKDSFDYEAYKKELKLENRLPRLGDEFSILAFKDAESKANSIIEELGIKEDPYAYEIVQLDDLLMNNNGEEWILTCKNNFLRKIEDEERHYYELKANNKGLHKSLSLYAYALMDVASLNDSNIYKIIIHQGDAPAFSLSKDRAIELLNMIFNAINDYRDKENYFSYLDFKDKDVESFNSLMKFIGDADNGKWNYFPYTKLFDLENQTGFDKDNYELQNYYDIVNKIIELIEFASKKEIIVKEGETIDGGI